MNKYNGCMCLQFADVFFKLMLLLLNLNGSCSSCNGGQKTNDGSLCSLFWDEIEFLQRNVLKVVTV